MLRSLILAATFLLPLSLFSQSLPSEAEELLEFLTEEESGEESQFHEVIREKIRVDQATLRRILTLTAAGAGTEVTSRPVESSAAEGPFDETAVSASTDVESEIHAAVNPTDSNNIVVGVINLHSNTSGLGAPETTAIYFTKDFGRTWKKSNDVLITRGFSQVIGGGDPMFAFDAEGTLYYSWIDLALTQQFSLRNAMSWAKSTDGGESWEIGRSSIGAGQLQGQNARMFDKQWMAVDRTDSEYRGNLYTGLLDIRGRSGLVGIRVKPAGEDAFVDETIHPGGSTLFSYNQLASTTVGPDGKLHLMFLGATLTAQGKMGLWHSASVDGGKSLLPPKRITPIEFPSRSAGQENVGLLGFESERIQPSSHIAADASEGEHSGNLYAVWAGNGITKREATGMDIYFTRSVDGGETWQEPWIVNDDLIDPETETRGTNDQFHPSIAVNDLGVITLTWYDRREDPDNRMTHFYAAHSFDGGATFTRNYRISSEASDFGQIGNRNGGFGIGEYVQTVTTDGYAIPVWADGRKNNGDVDVYIAFVPLSREPTGVERVSSLGSTLAIDAVDFDPTSETARIRASSIAATEATVSLHDLRGRHVRTLYSGRIAPDGTKIDLSTKDLAPGTWFVQIAGPDGMATRAMQIVR